MASPSEDECRILFFLSFVLSSFLPSSVRPSVRSRIYSASFLVQTRPIVHRQQNEKRQNALST